MLSIHEKEIHPLLQNSVGTSLMVTTNMLLGVLYREKTTIFLLTDFFFGPQALAIQSDFWPMPPKSQETRGKELINTQKVMVQT
jgi:hypothetical protein